MPLKGYAHARWFFRTGVGRIAFAIAATVWRVGPTWSIDWSSITTLLTLFVAEVSNDEGDENPQFVDNQSSVVRIRTNRPNR